MKIWLDDVRPMPPQFDYWAKTADEAWRKLLDNQENCFISFDHDLGLHYTGYDLAKRIEIDAAEGYLIYPITWEIHSANPVGRKNIEQAMRSAERFWSHY